MKSPAHSRTGQLGQSLGQPQHRGVKLSSCVSGRWFPWFAQGLLAMPLVGVAGCGTLGRLPSLSSPLAASSTAQLAAPVQTQRSAEFAQAIATPTPEQSDLAAVVPASFARHSSLVGNSLLRGPAAAGLSDGCSTCNNGAIVGEGRCGCAAAATGDPFCNAQEYIYDGGDLDPQVVVQKDWSVAGMNPTDTVIFYETLGGNVCEQPSNRVAIYAPRFGAVRQVSGLILSTGTIGTERMLSPVAAQGFDDHNLAGTVVAPVAPLGEQQVRLIDAFQGRDLGTPLDQVVPLSRMSAARVPFELVDVRRTGLITREEMIDVLQLIQNAETWVIPEALMVEISDQPALEVRDTAAPQDLVLYETPDKCCMRIFKAASHTIANSGDIVSFAIRFDNAGIKPLGNVVISDSLSPRLDYIQGSQQCSVGVRFSAEPNDVGSTILRWEIEEPIDPSQGGVITFDCRVR